ncbi:lipid-A-disaccharide synthase [Helicobacter kayseriensis]|uniref:lipid-A-disaccharide synthase n=1 Tax=Helicobacter kayseriensis TaxID=2905877 RepID=UPI001E32C2E3|nr:lipid-A-disaccharide synthase [Helicobacter kayseriensis]MCE3047935.1 lipid-A-disaccharide synthase [Helicobacter kayseriensis]
MRILVSALEASSNLHLSELRKHLCGVEWIGIYEFEDSQGLYTPKDFSVMGFYDVLKKIFFFKRVMKEMLILAEKADQVLLLDSSSFHIPLAKAIKKRFPNKKISYYILPQVWAWKPWRIETLKCYFDYLYGILPFEISLYEGRATYIGHPLLDEIIKQKQNLSRDGSIVFMPGSRRGEIKRIFPIFCELLKYFKNEKCVLVIPSFYAQSNLEEIYGEEIHRFEICFDAQEALYESKFAFICSGTATLQAALIGTPFVLCYKAKKIDEWIVRSLIRLSHIGLANILSLKSGGGEMHPELIQKDCNAKQLFWAYQNMDFEQFFLKSQELKKYLQFGSSENLARALMK